MPLPNLPPISINDIVPVSDDTIAIAHHDQLSKTVDALESGDLRIGIPVEQKEDEITANLDT